jgi:hypothetical protein
MLRRLSVAGCLAVVATLSVVTPAQASSPISCSPGQVFDPTQGTCVIVVVAPPVGSKGGGGVTAGGGSTGGAGAGPQKCVKPDGAAIPCRDGNSWWSNDLSCYIALADPQPPKSDPSWAGHTDGAIYTCYSPLIVAGTPLYSLWSATPPAGPVAPPDPRVLAQQAIALMTIRFTATARVTRGRAGWLALLDTRRILARWPELAVVVCLAPLVGSVSRVAGRERGCVVLRGCPEFRGTSVAAR